MHAPRNALLAIAVAAAAGSATAQHATKPGLWEIRANMKSSGGQMEQAMAEMRKQMDSMPPDQRKMMQDMLAKQGMAMGAGGPGMNIRRCITPEMAAQDDVPLQDGDCKQTITSRSAKALEVRFTCTDPQSSGTGRFAFVDAQNYTATVKTTTLVDGKKEQVDMDMAGKWLSPDCGKLSPAR